MSVPSKSSPSPKSVKEAQMEPEKIWMKRYICMEHVGFKSK